MSEKVEHPNHYNQGGIEAIKVINAYKLGFYDGNIITYILRAKFKGHELEDLKKAKWYLDRYIQLKEEETVKK